jgi:hypothetical protein
MVGSCHQTLKYLTPAIRKVSDLAFPYLQLLQASTPPKLTAVTGGCIDTIGSFSSITYFLVGFVCGVHNHLRSFSTLFLDGYVACTGLWV